MTRRHEMELAINRVTTYLVEKQSMGLIGFLWQTKPSLAGWQWCTWQFATSKQYMDAVLSQEIARLCYINNHSPQLRLNDCVLPGTPNWWLKMYPRDEKLPRLVEAHIPMMAEYLTKAYLCGGRWKPPEEG